MANLFSISRFFLAILFLALILSDKTAIGIGVLIAAALTDFIDGQIARRFDRVTELGTLLDPIADRFLVLTVVAAFIIKYWNPLYIAAAILLFARELILGLGVLWFKSKGLKLEVSVLGKVSTAFVFTSFVITFILPKQGIYLLYVGIVIYFVSASGYFFEARRQIVQKNLIN